MPKHGLHGCDVVEEANIIARLTRERDEALARIGELERQREAAAKQDFDTALRVQEEVAAAVAKRDPERVLLDAHAALHKAGCPHGCYPRCQGYDARIHQHTIGRIRKP